MPGRLPRLVTNLKLARSLDRRFQNLKARRQVRSRQRGALFHFWTRVLRRSRWFFSKLIARATPAILSDGDGAMFQIFSPYAATLVTDIQRAALSIQPPRSSTGPFFSVIA